MQIRDLPKLIQDLEQYRIKGGKTYSEVNKLLLSEATTFNIEAAQALLNKLAHK